jgi:hypothetical protein
MLDYAKPDELNHGLHYAIRADAPELVNDLLKRGASLEQAMLIHYGAATGASRILRHGPARPPDRC